MARIVRCALIQAACSTPAEEFLETIKRDAIEKHLKMIEEAAVQGAKILCMQERPHRSTHARDRKEARSGAYCSDL